MNKTAFSYTHASHACSVLPMSTWAGRSMSMTQLLKVCYMVYTSTADSSMPKACPQQDVQPSINCVATCHITLKRLIAMSSNLKWGKFVSNSHGIEVNNRIFWPRGPSSAVTLTCMVLGMTDIECSYIIMAYLCQITAPNFESF